MDSSDFSFSRIWTCPWCSLQQASKVTVTGVCRRCRRPLPDAYLELCDPSNKGRSDLSDADALRNLIGNTLRRLRLRRGCTQFTLASALRTHRTHVSRIETGRVAPTPVLLLRAAAALGVERIVLCISRLEPKLLRVSSTISLVRQPSRGCVRECAIPKPP